MTEQQITVLDIKKLLSVHPADILAVEHRGKLIELDDAARVVPYPQPGVSN